MTLSFQADLEITAAGSSIGVSNDDAGALVVTTSELRPVVGALRSDGLLPSGTLRTVSDILADGGGTVHLRTPSTELLTLGADASPTVLTRTVGLHHVQIESLRGLLLALRPPLPSVVRTAAAGAAVVAVALVIRGHRHRPQASRSRPRAHQ